MDFLTKELLATYDYTDCNLDRRDSTEVISYGRTYLKLGTRTATCVVANLYKLCTPSDNSFNYVAFIGISRQHPCDVKITKEEGLEKAQVNARISPIATINFDHKVSYYEIKPILEGILNSQAKRFVKTRQEIIASGGANDLVNKKYKR